MKILFISTNYPYPTDTGHNLRTFNILKALAERHDVFYLAYSKKKSDIMSRDPIKEMCLSVNVFMIPDELSKTKMIYSLFMNIFSQMPYVAHKYYSREMREKIKQIVKNNRIDLVHIDLLHLSRYAELLGAIPKALTEHNVESHRVWRLAKNSKNPVFKLYMYMQYKKLYAFEKKMCSMFDVCITVSEDDSKRLKEISPGANLIEIPNGVDTKYFQPGLGEIEPHSMIWVGGMHDLYNREAVEFFCHKIFPQIHDKIEDVKFVAIGASPPRSLIDLAAQNENVKILGYVDDIRPYLDAASVFVAPIKSGGGTKFKVLNALAMGKAVVTTTVGAEGINVRDGENVMIADDATVFAQKTIALLSDSHFSISLGKEGRKLIIKEYDLTAIGKRQNDLYELIATSQTPPRNK